MSERSPLASLPPGLRLCHAEVVLRMIPVVQVRDVWVRVRMPVETCELRLILHPAYRARERRRRRHIRAWRFPDESYCVEVGGVRPPHTFHALDWDGPASNGLLMRDICAAERSALEGDGEHWTDLVGERVRLHRTLPSVAPERIAAILSAPRPEVRLVAFACLRARAAASGQGQ